MHLDGRLLLRQPALSQRPIAAAAGKCREPQRARALRPDQHQGFLKHRDRFQPGRACRLAIRPWRQADQRGIEGGGEYPLG